MGSVRRYFTWPVVLGAFGIALLLCLGSLMLVYIITPAPPQMGMATAMIRVTPGPSATPIVPTLTPTLAVTPTSSLPASPLPGVIGVGSFVQISGTEGTGLNIRVEAGLNSAVRFISIEEEVFEVKGGPVVIDGITWWYLVTPLDAERSGWAAANYLSLVPKP